MNAVRTAHGADPLLGRETLVALDIGLRACAPGSASASEEIAGRRENMLSPAGVRRTDLCHGSTGATIPRLSIIVPSSRRVVIDLMIGSGDLLDGLLPGRDDAMRSNAAAAIGFARHEIEEWLRTGDDAEAHRIARLAMLGCAPAVFAAMTDAGPRPGQICVRHATPWGPGGAAGSFGAPPMPGLYGIIVKTAGDAMPPPVSSIQFEEHPSDLRVTIGPTVAHLSPDRIDVLDAMRRLDEADRMMKERG